MPNVLTSFDELPPAVKTVVLSDDVSDANVTLRAAHTLSPPQYDYMLRTIREILLSRIGVLDLSSALSRMPAGNRVDLRKLALDIALTRLWPLQDYLGTVDVLINRLGGRAPEKIPLPRPETDSATEEEVSTVSWLPGSAKDMLERFPRFAEMYLTHRPIRDTEGRLRPPTVTVWLQDYLHTMGATGANSLKRSQYLAKSGNTRTLTDEEKMNLLNFLESYEDMVDMYWRVTGDSFLLIERELPKEAARQQRSAAATLQLSALTDYYRNMQENYARVLEDKKRGLKLEIGENTRKLADIVWDSLGLGDTDRCVAAIDLMLDRQIMQDILKTDQRFRGIVARMIEVKYGLQARARWNGDFTQLSPWFLFLRLLLADKLRMEEGRAAIIADYLNKKAGYRMSPLYLDLNSGKFLFREITYENGTLAVA
ncbi:MAG: hypothetical protein A3B30_01135 [Candidatus Komeilibacteria bacterium RIFCSPLOWO2_01_FULL_52_15]|uniref:Uncharacterized protein n=2 Tax=Candidatus Komeiliibacteriota TaxID=1817908 RepID=A0A1G2BSK5_9BACT|nr:MAG: hypothetical protein A2677_01615 [Candidatus Komeilibacteria bacterium RIFCSPHIGHO2_01_FULL_52_14]OGY91866.1 MAG: hypothetical protein A3B30_01135 [Candidatus Komeilibacteria bacterium RIFCSPLOWO2_01_FULL_52_15]